MEDPHNPKNSMSNTERGMRMGDEINSIIDRSQPQSSNKKSGSPSSSSGPANSIDDSGAFGGMAIIGAGAVIGLVVGAAVLIAGGITSLIYKGVTNRLRTQNPDISESEIFVKGTLMTAGYVAGGLAATFAGVSMYNDYQTQKAREYVALGIKYPTLSVAAGHKGNDYYNSFLYAARDTNGVDGERQALALCESNREGECKIVFNSRSHVPDCFRLTTEETAHGTFPKLSVTHFYNADGKRNNEMRNIQCTRDVEAGQPGFGGDITALCSSDAMLFCNTPELMHSFATELQESRPADKSWVVVPEPVILRPDPIYTAGFQFDAEKGNVVSGVILQGPAYEEGFRKGDTITHIDNVATAGMSADEITKILDTQKAGTHLVLLRVKDGVSGKTSEHMLARNFMFADVEIVEGRPVQVAARVSETESSRQFYTINTDEAYLYAFPNKGMGYSEILESGSCFWKLPKAYVTNRQLMAIAGNSSNKDHFVGYIAKEFLTPLTGRSTSTCIAHYKP